MFHCCQGIRNSDKKVEDSIWTAVKLLCIPINGVQTKINGGYLTLYICQNSQNYRTKSVGSDDNNE